MMVQRGRIHLLKWHNHNLFFVIEIYHMSERETYQLGVGSPNWWWRWRGLNWRRHTLLDRCEKNQGWWWHDLCLVQRLADNLWVVGALSLQLWQEKSQVLHRRSSIFSVGLLFQYFWLGVHGNKSVTRSSLHDGTWHMAERERATHVGTPLF